MKSKFVSLFVFFCLVSYANSSFCRSSLIARDKVETYAGILKIIEISEDDRLNFFLFVSDKEVYQLLIPFHLRSVALLCPEKRVEVKGVYLGKPKEGMHETPRVKVKNIVPRPKP